VNQKYKTEKQQNSPLASQPLFDSDEPPEPKTNYLTDDSDSDLDVFVDPTKTKLPPQFKPE